MKKIIILSLILIGCAKNNPEPEPVQQTNPIVVAPKYVEIFINHGSVNNFVSVKWSFDPEIDSSYVTTNNYNRTIRNYTTSDSILIFSNSGAMVNDNVTIYVNSIIKEQYIASQTAKVIKLN